MTKIRKRVTAAKGARITITVSIAVMICAKVPFLQEYQEFAIPLLSGLIRMAMNQFSQRTGIDIFSLIK